MRKPEQKVYDSMKKNAPKTAWLQRVENLVGEGMPDVHVSGPESECWVELKAAKRPKRETTRLLGGDGVRQSQINWHLKANTKAIKSYILIRDDHNALYLIHGNRAAAINDMTIAELKRDSLGSTWDEIFQQLMWWDQ